MLFCWCYFERSQWSISQISAKYFLDKSLTDTARQTLFISNFKDWLKEKIHLLRTYHELVFVKNVYHPRSLQGISITDILKRDLCNIFTDCLVHPTHDNWNTATSCCISIIFAKSSVRFFIEKKIFLIIFNLLLFLIYWCWKKF